MAISMRLGTSYVDVALPEAMRDYATAEKTNGFAYARTGNVSVRSVPKEKLCETYGVSRKGLS